MIVYFDLFNLTKCSFAVSIGSWNKKTENKVVYYTSSHSSESQVVNT